MSLIKSDYACLIVYMIDSTFEETSDSRLGSITPNLSTLKNGSELSGSIPAGFRILILSETRKFSATSLSGTNFKNSGYLEYLNVNEFKMMANFISIISASRTEM
jgi:hypothetical protein